MAKKTIPEKLSGESGRSDLREMDWTIAKTLLDANAHTVRAFESHLLRTYREDASPDVESMRSNIQQAIDEHEKILEELEVAAEALAELES